MLQVRFLFERPSAWELVRRVEPAAGPGVGSVSCSAASSSSAPEQLQQSAAGKPMQLMFSRRSQVRHMTKTFLLTSMGDFFFLKKMWQTYGQVSALLELGQQGARAVRECIFPCISLRL